MSINIPTSTSAIKNVPALTESEKQIIERLLKATRDPKYPAYSKVEYLDESGKLQENLASGKDIAGSIAMYKRIRDYLEWDFAVDNIKQNDPKVIAEAQVVLERIGKACSEELEKQADSAPNTDIAEFSKRFSQEFLGAVNHDSPSRKVDNNRDGVYLIENTGGNDLGLNGQLVLDGFARGKIGIESTGYFNYDDHASRYLSEAIQDAADISALTGMKFEKSIDLALRVRVDKPEFDKMKQTTAENIAAEKAVEIARYFGNATKDGSGLDAKESKGLQSLIQTSDEAIRESAMKLQKTLSGADTNGDGVTSRFEIIKATDKEVRSPDFRIAEQSEPKENLKQAR